YAYVVFFLLLRPPLIAPLFPYTTLFRSFGPLVVKESTRNGTPVIRAPKRWGNCFCCSAPPTTASTIASGSWLRSSMRLRAEAKRSEEHTSELQSRGHLVCRLLLEKKKKK